MKLAKQKQGTIYNGDCREEIVGLLNFPSRTARINAQNRSCL